MMDAATCPIIILAAGASTRMGRPKQLLRIGNQTFLERTIHFAEKANCYPIMVVLGANKDIILPTLVNHNIEIVWNKNWREGMGTSLKVGIDHLVTTYPKSAQVIVSVCDQPYLDEVIFSKLINTFHSTETELVVSKYEDRTLGVPALFSKSLFPKLQALDKDQGARKIIRQYPGEKREISFPKGSIDLDTPEAYQQFLKEEKRFNTK